jgi:hypothetical protein
MVAERADNQSKDKALGPEDFIIVERDLNLPSELIEHIETFFSEGKLSSDRERKTRISRGARIHIRRLKQADKDNEAETYYEEALRQAIKRKREILGKPASKDDYNQIALIETFGNIVLAKSRVDIAAYGVKAITLLGITHSIDQDDRKRIISELYDMNAKIEDKIIERYGEIRGNF